MQRKLKYWLFAISSLYLTSCTPRPPNVYVFKHLAQKLSIDPKTGHTLLTPSPTCMKQIQEAECLYGVSIVSGTEIYVGAEKAHWFNGKPWTQLNDESVQCPAEECYAPLAGYIIDSCKKMNCDSQVTGFKVKLDSLNGVSGAIKNP